MAKQTEETKALKAYIAELNKHYRKGNATEHTYRPALQRLLEELIPSGFSITNEPKHIVEVGAPDYVMMRSDTTIGYIEAKDIGVDLDHKANKEQFDRYRQSLNNLIITDYMSFRLYVDGELVTSASIATADRSGIDAEGDLFDTFLALVSKFVGHAGQKIRTAENLSKQMAAKAKYLANVIDKALNQDNANKDNMNGNIPTIYGQLLGVREILIADIPINEFSDIYAQTIAYGMFAAKLNDNQTGAFTRRTAAELITHSNPFLRNFFQDIAAFDLDERIRWIVDDLADLFNHVDVDAIVAEFGSEHDPTIHLYETFLKEYDPDLRQRRGVWYTPKSVVQFIVRAVDEILIREFKLPRGLADSSKVTVKRKNDKGKTVEKEFHKVQILDPATGTGTFLVEIVKHIHNQSEDLRGAWQSYTTEHLIPRINGFEILMASYTMAHIKLDMILRQTGYKHPANKRLRIYLTNSLEEAKTRSEVLFAQWLSNEANEASAIKQDVPVMVIMGNPPYNVSTQNKNAWIDGLIAEYKQGLNEKKLNLDDDYIKFIRYGQHFIERNKSGVLAYISNNSFIDGVTHRKMRETLLRCFDKIYILDLHGSSIKNEAAPDGTSDGNVFGILLGVSINIFVKTSNSTKPAKVYHCDLFGKQENKFKFLSEHDFSSIKWKIIHPEPPYFFFVPKAFDNRHEYEMGFSITELFTTYNSAIKTDRDALFIDMDKEILQKRIQKLLSKNYDKAFAETYNVFDSGSYKLTAIIPQNKFEKNNLRAIQYRPFDYRHIYYKPGITSRPAFNVMQHFINNENIGLCLMRGQVNTTDFKAVFVSQDMMDINFYGFQTYFFPLYLYPQKRNNQDSEDAKVQSAFGPQARNPNLNNAIIAEIEQKTGLRFTKEKGGGKTFAPIDVLDYIYAVLHTPAYRERFNDFLKIDFPRVPYPKDAKSFRSLVGIGKTLRKLHLLEDIEPKKGLAGFPIDGDNEIDTVRYNAQKVYINANQYFDHVPQEAWDFHIGGRQPAKYWLTKRKNQTLGVDDIWHYQKIIYVLRETAKIMQTIDLPE